jgi:hypothetical protein
MIYFAPVRESTNVGKVENKEKTIEIMMIESDQNFFGKS